MKTAQEIQEDFLKSKTFGIPYALDNQGNKHHITWRNPEKESRFIFIARHQTHFALMMLAGALILLLYMFN